MSQIDKVMVSGGDTTSPSEQVDAAKQAVQRSRPAIRSALVDFVTGQLKTSSSASGQEIRALVRTGAGELREILRMTAARNVLVEGGKDAATRFGLAEADWQDREKLLPPWPPIAVPEDSAVGSYNRTTFPLSVHHDTHLAQALEAGVDQVANYAEAMVSRGQLGFVDYYDPERQLGAYCYVIRRIRVVEKTEKAEHVGVASYSRRLPEFDRPDAPDGHRKAYLMHQKRRGSAVYWTEKHSHVLQRASSVPFPDYREAMPIWAQRVGQEIPDWLAPGLQVLQGAIVHEEVCEQDVETKDWSLAKVKDVAYDSPALTLGHLVLTGWSSQDLVYRGDNFRLAEIDGEQYLSPAQRQAREQATHAAGNQADTQGALPLIFGAAVAFLCPGAWWLRALLGFATAGLTATCQKKN